MLNWLKISNLALIESADVEFGPAFNAVTGETGAGKSILLSTVALLLGERAEKSLIRTGKDRCEIAAGISIVPGSQPELDQLLADAGIALDPGAPEIQLRRIITPSQNRNFINDSAVTLPTLKAIGEYLVNIHGANEHQSLISRSKQLSLLDRYANARPLQEKCKAHMNTIRQLQQEQSEALSKTPSPLEARHLEALIHDIEQVNPQVGEDVEISTRHKLAANSIELKQSAFQAIRLLTDSENSLADQLGEVHRTLFDLNRIDTVNGSRFLNSCEELTETIRDLARELEHYGSEIDLDEEAFAALENRLAAIQTLKRRYAPTLEQIFSMLEEARQKLELYKRSASIREEYDARIAAEQNTLETVAGELSSLRRDAAKKLCSQVCRQLARLGFKQSRLELEFSVTEPGANGMDQVDFLFSANPGETPRPLRQIASSGELSRIMLALKTVLATADAVPVVIFDEIDVNIGGETAREVGLALRELSQSRQLLAISHLPQVAACADHHYAVAKHSDNDRTQTHIHLLNFQQRQAELTRMLGGGEAARQHAISLLEAAQQP